MLSHKKETLIQVRIDCQLKYKFWFHKKKKLQSSSSKLIPGRRWPTVSAILPFLTLVIYAPCCPKGVSLPPTMLKPKKNRK